ncbi:MAG: hypothetical protein AAF331_13900, partial [Pseudomonadota bacterium]
PQHGMNGDQVQPIAPPGKRARVETSGEEGEAQGDAVAEPASTETVTTEVDPGGMVTMETESMETAAEPLDDLVKEAQRCCWPRPVAEKVGKLLRLCFLFIACLFCPKFLIAWIKRFITEANESRRRISENNSRSGSIFLAWDPANHRFFCASRSEHTQVDFGIFFPSPFRRDVRCRDSVDLAPSGTRSSAGLSLCKPFPISSTFAVIRVDNGVHRTQKDLCR